jgi:LPXTG-motif cell wall-anchored protein
MTLVHRSTRLLLVAAALLFAFAGVRIASAHAKLKSSLPAAGSTVAAPERIVAVFANHDPLVPSVSTLSVVDASGAQVDQGDSKLDPAATGESAGRTLVVSLKPNLSDGVYTVNWEAGAADAVSQGSFQFTIQAGATAATMADAPAPAADTHADAPATQALPNTGTDSVSLYALLIGIAAIVFALGLNIRRRSAL